MANVEDTRGELEALTKLAMEVASSIPATYTETDPMVMRHAAALNDLLAWSRSQGEESDTTQQETPLKDGDHDYCEDCGVVMVYVESHGYWLISCECGVDDDEEEDE